MGICNVHSIELIELLENLELYEQDIGLLYIYTSDCHRIKSVGVRRNRKPVRPVRPTVPTIPAGIVGSVAEIPTLPTLLARNGGGMIKGKARNRVDSTTVAGRPKSRT